jgi:MoaA/NifB/PqqE/SkfB family radical SAM enzyme
MEEAPRRPFRIIYIELTNACNFTCDYCPIDRQTRKKVAMSAAFARNVLDQIADNELTDTITFHVMGEPYLHRDLTPLTAHAESRGLQVRLLTNGSLLNSKTTRALFDANLSYLEVGFRTPNESSFSMRLRGHSLSLEQYIVRVKNLLEDKIRSQARTTVAVKFFIRTKAAEMGLGDPYEHLTSHQDNLAMAQLFRDHALDIARQEGLPIAEWARVPVRVTDGSYEILPGVMLNWSRIQDFWMHEQRGHQQAWKAVVCGCSAAFRDNFGILASGEVTTCCVDYDGKNVVGDLRKNSLMEILASDEARRMKRSLEWFRPPTEFCRECKGGPTLTMSVLKQAGTVYLEAKARILGRPVRTL